MEAITEQLYGDGPERLWNADTTEEYVLSVCLHNKQALAQAMNSLYSQRDFQGQNAKAFAILENYFEAGKEIDPVTIQDIWVDMKIYSKQDAKGIVKAWKNDTNFKPKIDELSTIGGVRKAKNDIASLNNDANGKDATPEKLAQKAFDLAVSWNKGFSKKYFTAREVHKMKDERGEKLSLGIPLFDDQVYKYSGLHKGTVKARIFRSKHGKTRSECYEVAQHLRQGRTVMYFTLEGQNGDILDNVKQILKDEWREYQDQFLLVDDCFTIGDIRSAFIEAEFTEGVDVLVVDYLQEVMLDTKQYVGENQRINDVCREITHLATQYDCLVDLLSQVTTTSKSDKGYGHVPRVDDMYGSKKLKKAASMIVVGFRPKNYEELLKDQPLPPNRTGVQDPEGGWAPLSSVFLKPALSRKKLPCQHRWVHFVDTDSGLTLHQQELI